MLFIMIASGIFLLRSYFKTASKETLIAAEIRKITRTASRHFLLPSDETPTMATVADAAALARSQPFFVDSQNGDKVLLYSKKHQAILYRPSTDMIINVGPIQYGVPQHKTDTHARIRVEIRNGTHTHGAASRAAQELSANNSGYTVLKIGDAIRNDYTSAMAVVTREGIAKTDIDFLTSHFSASVTSHLPNGEAPSSADVILILGASAQ